MLKINESQILKDYNDLLEKQNIKFSEIEEDARGFASIRGYDEEKTKQLIDFIKTIENDGLTVEEKVKIHVLSEYIEDIAQSDLLNPISNEEFLNI